MQIYSADCLPNIISSKVAIRKTATVEFPSPMPQANEIALYFTPAVTLFQNPIQGVPIARKKWFTPKNSNPNQQTLAESFQRAPMLKT